MDHRIRYYNTHAHIGHAYKNKKLENPFGYDYFENCHEILSKAYEIGVEKVIGVAIGIPSNRMMLEKFKDYPWGTSDGTTRPQIGVAVGEHPTAVGGAEAVWFDGAKDLELKELSKDPRVCALKTGLDYHHGMDNKERQQERFRRRIQMSRELSLPLVLHIREAYEDALRILEEESDGSYHGVIHCFTEDPDTAYRFTEKGFLLGIGGKVTYERNEALRKTVKEVSLKHLVLETDCPYIPLCGSKYVNTSLDIPVIAQTIAEIKEVSLAESAEVTYTNAERLFG